MNIVMGWPEWIWLVCVVLTLLVNYEKDGQLKDERHSLSKAMFNCFLTFGLLYWGGFFS